MILSLKVNGLDRFVLVSEQHLNGVIPMRRQRSLLETAPPVDDRVSMLSEENLPDTAWDAKSCGRREFHEYSREDSGRRLEGVDPVAACDISAKAALQKAVHCGIDQRLDLILKAWSMLSEEAKDEILRIACANR